MSRSCGCRCLFLAIPIAGLMTISSAAYAATCMVTNPAGTSSPNSGTLLRHLNNQPGAGGFDECDVIEFAVNAIDPLEVAPMLLPGTTLRGNGKVVLRLASGAVVGDDDCVVDLQWTPDTLATPSNDDDDGAVLENLTIDAGTHSGVCIYSDRNRLNQVKVTGSNAQLGNTGVRVEGRENQLTGVTVQKVGEGIEFLGDANGLVTGQIAQNGSGVAIGGDDNVIGGSAIGSNLGVGVTILGSRNVIGVHPLTGNYAATTIGTNGEDGVIVSGSGANQNKITRTAFQNNGMIKTATKGIALLNDGNDLWDAPKSVRAIFKGGPSATPAKYGLVGVVRNGTGEVEVFIADSATSGEGAAYKTTITKVFANGAGASDRVVFGAVVDAAAVPLTASVVATALQQSVAPKAAAHTSEFSAPVKLGTKPIDGDPEKCLTVSWFVLALEKALEKGPEADPWAEFCPDGKKTLGEGDPQHTCAGDPCQPTIVLICATAPELCTFPKFPDSDGDGVVDLFDNCPSVPNPDQLDSDGDKIGDACEDFDEDGIPNLDDNCPCTPNPDQADLDDDTAGDACDPDLDNDGLLNDDEAAAGTDPRLADSDGDKVCDGPGWGFGLVGSPSRCLRPDDNCPLVKNTNQIDTDEDQIGNECDLAATRYRGTTDSDGDGFPDNADLCPYLKDGAALSDGDGDGVSDPCDPDDDNDGLEDWAESGSHHWVPVAYFNGDVSGGQCVPLDPKRADSDGDGLCDGPVLDVPGECQALDTCPDYFEAGLGALDGSVWQHLDDDGDAIGNICEDAGRSDDPDDADDDGEANTSDNCPLIPNPDQWNTDGDTWSPGPVKAAPQLTVNVGGGDACDPDDDNDQASDIEEGGELGINPWEPDSDHYTGSGFDDYCDGPGTGYGTLAANKCRSNDNCRVRYNPDQLDANDNGIGDVCETIGEGDKDRDGIPDTIDNCPVLQNEDQADNDGDGLGDVCDPDDDNDGILDQFDNCPLIPNPDQSDVDHDGVGDACLLQPSTSVGQGSLQSYFETIGGFKGGCSLIVQE